jgi:polysaccharide export outer membrane protein
MRLRTFSFLMGVVTLAVQGQQTRPAISAPVAPSASAASAGVPVSASADPNALTVSSETYIISTGDTLQLNVWKEPSLSNGAIAVRPDGRISLPLIGDLPASGMTPTLLGHDIAERLKKYITDPLVTVTVIGTAPKEIFLIGEIQKTGPIILTPGMNTLQAIAAAGGISPFAKKKLYILRKDAKGEQKIPFDYKKALKTGDAQGITLMPGDTIVVP